MAARLLVAALTITTSLSLAPGIGPDDRSLGQPDHGALPRPHVDTLLGEAVLLADSGGRRIVLGLDRLDARGRTDGRLDHVILFAPHGPLEAPLFLKGRAHVQFWHDGLRVSFPDRRVGFDLEIEGSTPPQALEQTPFRLEKLADGAGLSEYSGPIVGSLSLDQLEAAPLDGPILDDGGGEPGGGGGRPCEPASCSITCTNGSGCTASSGAGRFATCVGCPNPICSCATCG